MTLPSFSLNDFLELAKSNRVIPICKELSSGTASPVGLFEKLALKNPGSFLLESAEAGVWARYSFVGVRMRGRLLQESSSSVEWLSITGESPIPVDLQLELPRDPLGAIELIQQAWHTKLDNVSLPITSGLVGALAWAMVGELENIEVTVDTDTHCPIVHLSLVRDMVVLDHLEGKLFFISNCFIEGQDDEALTSIYLEAQSAIQEMVQALLKPSPEYLAEIELETQRDVGLNTSEEQFLQMVEKAREHVTKGDVFQVVLSQKFSSQLGAEPLDVYRALRTLNPSPYMYLLNGEDSRGEFSIVGSSPESLFSVVDQTVITHPIAGSRPRGKGVEEDIEYEASLKADLKEVSEHLMLVDLARNDLLKVCKPDTVVVSEFKEVHRFSHIMHLVSTVQGILRSGLSAVDVFKATFPAGTLSGAPKPRALSLINSLEVNGRGLYGGVCGYFDFAGNADLAIAIRTAFIRNGLATVQAGAGIVLDSDPMTEYFETKHKATAVIRAVQLANSSKRML